MTNRTSEPRLAGPPGLLLWLALLSALAWVTHRYPRRVEREYQPAGEVLALGGPTHVIQGGAEDGPTVVLIHGSDGVALDWLISPLWSALQDDLRLIAYDRPGHGHSPVTPGEAVTVAVNVTRLHEVLSATGTQAPVILVGHSYGAAVALAYAQHDPERVAGAVLISPTAFPVPGLTRPLAYLPMIPGVEALLTRLLLLPVGRAVAWLEGRRAFWPAPVPPAWNRMMLAFSRRRMQVHALAWENRTLGQELTALARYYPTLQVPVTVLAGAHDRLTPQRHHARPLRAALPNAALHVLPDGGHQLHWTHVGVVARAIRALVPAVRSPP